VNAPGHDRKGRPPSDDLMSCSKVTFVATAKHGRLVGWKRGGSRNVVQGAAMAWEVRGHRQVYYRSRRQGDRVVKVYVGHGPLAERAAKLDAEVRARREADRQEARRMEATLEPLDVLRAEAEDGLRLLTLATFFAGGLHQHKGQWRQRRRRWNVDLAQ